MVSASFSCATSGILLHGKVSTSDNLNMCLSVVDKLLVKFKAWIYQHCILSCLLSPQLIYEIPIAIIEGFGRKIGQCLSRWLGLPQCLSKIALFGHNTKLWLPFSSLAVELKSCFTDIFYSLLMLK